MNFLEKTNIIELNNNHEFALILYGDGQYTEFAKEFGEASDGAKNIVQTAERIIKERYPGFKFTVIRVMVGGLIVLSIPFTASNQAAAQSMNDSTPTSLQVNETNHYYTVVRGDSLWGIAKKFNTSVELLKRANNLTSDSIAINQKLLIAKAIHTVKSGDTLYSLSRQYGTTVTAIKSANKLTSDLLGIGQSLIIPGAVHTQMENTSTPDTTVHTPETTYKVITGDTLWGIANRFGTTITALKAANSLKNDLLAVGQILIIPAANIETQIPEQTPPKQPDEPKETITFTYTVVSGDTLTKIANRFGATVDAIRAENNLRSDMLQIGQRLVIPNATNAPDPQSQNTIDYISHTVVSGDTIWGLSIKYGIPQSELLKVNKLTTASSLKIGQKLTIPVYNIAVKPVKSERHGELLDWFSEAQYVFTIGKTAKVTDLTTGRSFFIKRTIGANHADSETVTVNDTNIAKTIWGGFSWTPRAVLIEVDGRKLAASMSFMPHDQDYIANNGITGHFDVYFSNNLRHVDGKADPAHQLQVETAAGLR